MVKSKERKTASQGYDNGIGVPVALGMQCVSGTLSSFLADLNLLLTFANPHYKGFGIVAVLTRRARAFPSPILSIVVLTISFKSSLTSTFLSSAKLVTTMNCSTSVNDSYG